VASHKTIRTTRRASIQCFLVHFDLEKLGIPPKATSRKRQSVCVWDPSSAGKTKVLRLSPETAWIQNGHLASAGNLVSRGKTVGFEVGADAGPQPLHRCEARRTGPTPSTANRYRVDVTEMSSLAGRRYAQLRLAIAPVIDTSVDEGVLTRFQCSAPTQPVSYSPKLSVQVRK